MKKIICTGDFMRSDITRNELGAITRIDTYIPTDLEIGPKITAFDFGVFKDSHPNAQVNSIRESRDITNKTSNSETSCRVILVDSAHIFTGRKIPELEDFDEPLDINVNLGSTPSELEVIAVNMGSYALHSDSLSF